MAFELNMVLLNSMAPNDQSVGEAQRILVRGLLSDLTKSQDETLAWALVQGSGKKPYTVSADLAAHPERPVLRCSCPSRLHPCKHALCLALALAQGRRATIADPPADLLDKRAKYIARLASGESGEPAAAPKKEESPEKKAAREAKALATKKAAAVKLASTQIDALATLEKFVIDLVNAGLGSINDKTLQTIDEQARRMNDAGLRGTHALLIQFAAACREDKQAGKTAPKSKKPSKSRKSEETAEVLEDSVRELNERHGKMASLLGRLWVTLRRGQKMLAGKVDSDEAASETDAQLESLLGRAWKLPELKERGYWITDRTLIELCHEKISDPVLQMVTTRGYLLDLETGVVYVDWSSIPFMAMRHAAGSMRQSRMSVLRVAECALYPGAVANRRIRWDDKGGTVSEFPMQTAQFEQVQALSKTIDEAMKIFREQLKNPLSPHEAVLLIDAKRYGSTPDGTVVLEDSAGTRLVLRDPPSAKEPTMTNFIHAGGAFGAGPTAIRLWFAVNERVVYGQPMAIFAEQNHVRLGM